MSAKDIYLKVKALFDMPAPAPVAPVAAAAPVDPMMPPAPVPFKLKDGTEVSISMAGTEVAAGDMVTIAGAPAPEGEHEMEDGSKITVDATGMITAVTPMEPVTQPDFVAPPVISLEDRIKAIEAKIAAPQVPAPMPTGYATEAQFIAAEAKVTKQDEIIKGLFEMVEALIKEPTAEPKTLTGAAKDRFEKMNKKELAHKAMADAIAKMKEGK